METTCLDVCNSESASRSCFLPGKPVIIWVLHSPYHRLSNIACMSADNTTEATVWNQRHKRVQTVVLTLFGGLVSPPIREPASGAGQPMGGEDCAEAGCRAGRSYRFGHFSRISSLSAHTLPPHQRAFISAIFLHSTWNIFKQLTTTQLLFLRLEVGFILHSDIPWQHF